MPNKRRKRARARRAENRASARPAVPEPIPVRPPIRVEAADHRVPVTPIRSAPSPSDRAPLIAAAAGVVVLGVLALLIAVNLPAPSPKAETGAPAPSPQLVEVGGAVGPSGRASPEASPGASATPASAAPAPSSSDERPSSLAPTPQAAAATTQPVAAANPSPAAANPPPAALASPTPPPETAAGPPAEVASPAPAALGSDPASTVAAFYERVASGDFDAAYALWSERMREAYPREENLDGRFDETVSIAFDELFVASRTADAATVQANFTETYESGATRQFIGYWELVSVDGAWLLDAPHY